MNYPDPCIGCKIEANGKCKRNNCNKWKTRYLYRQKQINAYAKRNGIMPDSPVYQPGKNPCKDCRWEETCDSICIARAKYWDDRMRILRKELGA